LSTLVTWTVRPPTVSDPSFTRRGMGSAYAVGSRTVPRQDPL
jgi:hypothetical protein